MDDPQVVDAILCRILGSGQVHDGEFVEWCPIVEANSAYPERTWVPTDMFGGRIFDLEPEPMTDEEVAILRRAQGLD